MPAGTSAASSWCQKQGEPAPGGLSLGYICLLSARDVAFVAVVSVVPFLSATFGFIVELPGVIA